MKKSDIDYVIHNTYKIDHYRVKCYKNEDVHVPHEIPSNWIEVIKQALKHRYRINPANNEAELDLSSFSDDKILTENNLVLNFAVPRVFECVLNILKQELKELTKLNLSNNGLTTLYKLKSFISTVNILRLDLSNNVLTNTNELISLEQGHLIDLQITGNQFRRFSPPELKKEIRRILPNLKVINGNRLEDSVVIAGETLNLHKSIPPVVRSPRDSDAFNFILNFFGKFDSKTRDDLCDFYSTDSVLTMASYGDTLPFYRSHSANYRDPNRRKDNVKRGKAQILGTFSNFPLTKHLEATLNVDIVDSNELFMILVVSGAYVELPPVKSGNVGGGGSGMPYRVREFSRTMIIVQGGIVLQEFIQLLPGDSAVYQRHKVALETVKTSTEFARSHRDLENLSAEEVDIVRQFKTFSGMNVPTCLRFLKSFCGLEAASDEFKNLQAQGAIPMEAYRDE